MFYRTIFLALCASAGCGDQAMGRDAPSAHFHTREAESTSPLAEPGNLLVLLRNEIPRVDVPEPHVPTTIHLNAKLCSRVPEQVERARFAQADSTRPPLSGARKCVVLAPTIYHGTSVRQVITAAQLASLQNGDYTAFGVYFQSSSQTTSHDYPCRGNGSIDEVVSDQVNELAVTVTGQHSLAFDCKK